MGARGPGGPASPHSGVGGLEEGKENFENRAESNGDTACNATSRLEGESPVALPGGYSRNRGKCYFLLDLLLNCVCKFCLFVCNGKDMVGIPGQYLLHNIDFNLIRTIRLSRAHNI